MRVIGKDSRWSVAVGIPLYGYVPSYVYFRHMSWLVECSMRGYVRGLEVSENCYLPWARRDIVMSALDGPYTHLFFMDQDVVVPPDVIPRLLGHGKPIIGALYYQKIGTHVPVAGNFADDDLGWAPLKKLNNAPMRVDVIGMGATMIDLEVFRKLGTGDLSTCPTCGQLSDEGWFDMNARTGEDIEFCRRAQNAGFPIYVDPTIDTLHVGATPVSRKYFDAFANATPPVEPTPRPSDTPPPSAKRSTPYRQSAPADEVWDDPETIHDVEPL